MYPSRPRIRQFAVGVVDDFEKKVNQLAREKRAQASELSVIDVYQIVDAAWKEKWSTSEARLIWNSLLTAEDKKLVLQAKEEIQNAALEYCKAEASVFSDENAEESKKETKHLTGIKFNLDDE